MTSSSETAVLSQQFLSDMAHDLRSPLNGIINFAYLLRLGVEGELTPQQEGTVARIEQNGRHLLAMLNNLLDLMRLEQGRLEMDGGPTAVSDLVKAGCRPETAPVSWQLGEQIPLVWVDEARARQALRMLTAYLVETREAASLMVWAEGQADGVEIRLTGQAVAETAVATDKLLTVETKEDERLDAARLQLVLSARLLAAQNGTLHASATEQDLTFTLILPIAA